MKNCTIFQVALLGVENKSAPKLDFMTKEHFKHVLTLSQNQRHKYYRYLFCNNNSSNNDMVCVKYFLSLLIEITSN